MQLIEIVEQYEWSVDLIYGKQFPPPLAMLQIRKPSNCEIIDQILCTNFAENHNPQPKKLYPSSIVA